LKELAYRQPEIHRLRAEEIVMRKKRLTSKQRADRKAILIIVALSPVVIGFVVFMAKLTVMNMGH